LRTLPRNHCAKNIDNFLGGDYENNQIALNRSRRIASAQRGRD
jgi:hypothetical protein